MENYLIYIGKVALAAGAFYLAFLLLFQNRKQFSFNRIYLPVSFLLSFIIPLITFTTVKYIEVIAAPVDNSGFDFYVPLSAEPVSAPEFTWEWYHYLFGIFIIGLAGFLLNLLLGHLKAIVIIRKSTVRQFFDSAIHLTKKDVHPFSFFNKIVLSEKTVNSPNLEMIIEHEKVHVKEKHTFDILFSEILFLFQWFNPFAWLLKDAVKNNLEYKTDHEIAKRFNPKTYQLAMVALADKKGVAPFLTALNGSQLKNRIVMMKKKTENKYSLLKQMVVLPLLAVLVMGLSNKEVKTEIVKTEENITTNPLTQKIIVSGKIIDESGAPLDKVFVYYTDHKKIIDKTYSDKLGNYKIEIIEKNSLLFFRLDGFKSQSFKVDKSELLNVRLEKTKAVEDEFMEGLNPERTKNKNPSDPVIKGKEKDEKGETNDTVYKKPPQAIKILKYEDDDLSNALYLVNGVEVNSLEDVDQDNIEKVDVLKGESATKLYGEKGKNGAVLVTTKNTNQNNVGFDFGSFKDVPSTGNPVIIVDGQRYDSLEDANVQPDEIASISVLKNETASTKIYGEQAKDGVIIINTKTKYNSSDDIITPKIRNINNGGEPIFYKVEELPEFPGGELALRKYIANEIKYPAIAPEKGIQGKVYVSFIITKEGRVTEPEITKGVDPILDKEALRVVSGLPNWKPGKQRGEAVNVSYTVPITFGLQSQISTVGNPLIVVDGIITDYKSMDDINPDDIKSVTVWKDKSVLDVYGDNGKNGVIEITLKPENITTDLGLRKFIGREIKYPFEAQKNGIEGKIAMAVTFDKNGKIVKTDKSSPKYQNLDEVVVVAYNLDNKQHVQNNDSEILRQEMLRIINLIPAVEIDDFKGKTINVPVVFKLQDDNIQSNANDILIPEGFSPNGDGIHDVFEVRGLEKQYPNFEMKIFNSNGDLIWEYKHNGNPNSTPKWWDGKDKRNNIKKGTYSFEIELNDGSAKKTSGNIILAK